MASIAVLGVWGCYRGRRERYLWYTMMLMSVVNILLKNLNISTMNSCWISLVFLEYFCKEYFKEQKCCLNGNRSCPVQDMVPLHEALVSNVSLPGGKSLRLCLVFSLKWKLCSSYCSHRCHGIWNKWQNYSFQGNSYNQNAKPWQEQHQGITAIQ